MEFELGLVGRGIELDCFNPTTVHVQGVELAFAPTRLIVHDFVLKCITYDMTEIKVP